jgi:hypothetical protein
LTLTGLVSDVTYYFRVGSLDWGGSANLTSLGSTRTVASEIGVIISTENLDIGEVNLNTELVISTSFLVTSLGNVAQTYALRATTVTAGSPWTISLSSATDAFTLQALFNASQPVSSAFADDDKMLDAAAPCAAAAFSGDQSCVSVPAAAARLLWLKLGMPTITSTEAAQDIQITVTATPP